MFLLLILISVICDYVLVINSQDTDPCISRKYYIDDGGRSSVCSLQYDQCDRYISEGWYHVITKEGDLTMPNYCIKPNNCGTRFPIWMRGNIPTIGDGEVSRTACVSVPGDCCHHSYTIKVKNCTYFYSYYLKRCLGCPERYCFGTSNNCPTSTTASTTSVSEALNTEPVPASTLNIVTDKVTTHKPTSDVVTNDSACSCPNNSNRRPIPFKRCDSLNSTSIVFMVLFVLLLGIAIGLVMYLFIRTKRLSKVTDDREEHHYEVFKKPVKA